MELRIESLNFHHLRYFWMVVREGGVLPASRRLRVSHPTVSAQLRELEQWLGVDLFERRGRALELTELGRLTFEHAERVFAAGRDLLDAAATGRTVRRLRIGATDDLPKLFIREVIRPLLDAPEPPRIVIEEERQRTLLARLSVGDLDVVLSDAPTERAYRATTVDHELGSSGISVLAAPSIARRLRRSFPRSLDGAAWLAPLPDSQIGRVLSVWLRERGIRPEVVAEVADSALLKTLGADGRGAFAVPTVAELPARARYPLERVGRLENAEIRIFAATAVSPSEPVHRLLESARAALSAE